MTPDLQSQLMNSEIFTRGLQNPKCMAALKLLQSDPKEAEKRFKGDPDVDLFIREFSRIMGGHFSSMEKEAKTGAASSSSIRTVPATQPVQEIGPLHAAALAGAKKAANGHSNGVDDSTSSTTSHSSHSSATAATDDDERVREIVNDPELSAMLMDPELQQVLVECGDPVKFQQHMRDPVTAYKIKKLYKSGLVGTAK